MNLIDHDHPAPGFTRRQRDVEGLDADAPARRLDLTARQAEEFLVQGKAQLQIGEGRDRLQTIHRQNLVRCGDQRRQAGELHLALQALHLARRAGEVELGDGHDAGAGRGGRGPVDAAFETSRALDGRLQIVAGQGAEIVGLQAVLAEGQVGGADGQAAGLGLAVVAQVDPADGVFQSAQVEAAAPDVIGQSRLAHGRQRQEALRIGGVGDLGLSDARRHRQASRLAVHH
ncbi:hypothetical protein D3C80_841910 [compost metagenome]